MSTSYSSQRKLKRRLENAAERFNTLLFDLRDCEKEIDKKRASASKTWRVVHRPQIKKRIDSTLQTLKATKCEIEKLEKEIECKIKRKDAIEDALLRQKHKVRAEDSFKAGRELTALAEEVEELSDGRQKFQDVSAEVQYSTCPKPDTGTKRSLNLRELSPRHELNSL